MRVMPLDVLEDTLRDRTDPVRHLCEWWSLTTGETANHFAIYRPVAKGFYVNILWPNVGLRTAKELRLSSCAIDEYRIEFCITEFEEDIAMSRNCAGRYIESVSSEAAYMLQQWSSDALAKLQTLGIEQRPSDKEEAAQPWIGNME